MNRIATVASLSFLVISNAAWAAQMARSGQNVFTCDIKAINLDEGHSLLVGNWKGLQVTVANSPDHMSQIDCVGSVESMPDKSFKASGYCLHVDADGDKWIDRWWSDNT